MKRSLNEQTTQQLKNPPFSIDVVQLPLQPQQHSNDAIIKFSMPRWCFYLSWILKLDQWKVRYETIIKWTDNTTTEESSFFDRRRTAPATAAATFHLRNHQMQHAEMMLLPVLDFKIGPVEGEIWNDHEIMNRHSNWRILLFRSTSYISRYSCSDIPTTQLSTSECWDDASTYLGF